MKRIAPGLVDGVFILVLLLLVLSILDDSYAGRTHLLIGLLPAVLLLGLALLLQRRERWVWTYLIVVLLAYAPLGAVLALREPGPYVVPTLDTLGRVLGESFLAPMDLVNTLPPVDPSGSVALVPYAIGYVAAVAAVALALGTRHPVLPAVPVLAALTCTVPLGVLVPSHLVARGIAIGIVLVAWTAHRALRLDPMMRGSHGGLGRQVLAVMVIVAVSAGAAVMFPDRNEVDRVLLRGEGDAEVATASNGMPRRVTNRDELLRARGIPVGMPIRFATLDQYDGSAWTAAETSPGTDGFGTFRRIGTSVDAVNSGETLRVDVRIRPGYSSEWLPLIGELTSLELDYTDGRSQLSDVRYNQATGSALVVGGVDPRDRYTFTAVLPPSSWSDGLPMATADAEQRQPRGVFLDRFLGPFRVDGLEPTDQLQLLMGFLKENGAVRLTGSSSQKPVDLGLRLLGPERIVASPHQYTAVVALAASRLGVPARVVIGAMPDRRGIVRYDSVLSWVELQAADGTWRTVPPEEYTGQQTLADVESKPAAGGWVKDQVEKDKIRIPKGAPVTLPEGTEIVEEPSPWGIVAFVLLGILVLLALLWACVPLLKGVRRRRRRAAPAWSGQYVGGWQEVVDLARDRGTPVPEHLGRVPQARLLGRGEDLAREADDAVFAPTPASQAERDDFWLRSQDLRRELVSELSVWARLRTSFNPASLWSSWERRRDERRSGRKQVRDEDRRARHEPATRA